MKALLSLIAVCLVVTAALTVVAGTLNHFLELNLGLAVGGFDIALPQHFGEVVVLAVVQLILAALLETASDPGRIWQLVLKRKLLSLGILLSTVGALAVGLMTLAGGPLGLAVEAGDTAKVVQLLGQEQYTPEELNPLFYQALRTGNIEMAKALHKAGGDPNHRSGERNTPLIHSAVTWFPKDSVLLLLEEGVDLTSLDKFGRTPGHILLLYRESNFSQESDGDRLELLQKMTESGLDLSVAATDGSTVASLAERNKADWALGVVSF